MSTEIAGKIVYTDEAEVGHWYQIGDNHADKAHIQFTVYTRRLIPIFPAFMQVSYFDTFNPVIPDALPHVDWHFDYSDKWRLYYTIQLGYGNEHYRLLDFTDTAENGFAICNEHLARLEEVLKPELNPELIVSPLDVTLKVLKCSDQIGLMPESIRPLYEHYQRITAQNQQ